MPLTAADKIEIHELSARFMWANNTGDAVAWAETFLPDGVAAGLVGVLEGREAIAAHLERLWAGDGETEVEGEGGVRPLEVQHWATNYTVEGYGDEATAMGYVSLVQCSPEGGRILGMGTYRDVLRKVDGRWYFARRAYEGWPGSAGAPPL